MRPLEIVEPPKAIEGALLFHYGRSGRDFEFERAMKPLESTVLLRLGRGDALENDAELK